uniref:Uncharacterized protein n=1 Tax=Anopheles funestus TaxID=62324 RepID=A0A182S479_ANOFN
MGRHSSTMVVRTNLKVHRSYRTVQTDILQSHPTTTTTKTIGFPHGAESGGFRSAAADPRSDPRRFELRTGRPGSHRRRSRMTTSWRSCRHWQRNRRHHRSSIHHRWSNRRHPGCNRHRHHHRLRGCSHRRCFLHVHRMDGYSCTAMVVPQRQRRPVRQTPKTRQSCSFHLR